MPAKDHLQGEQWKETLEAFTCVDCKRSTAPGKFHESEKQEPLNEYYMVHNELWNKAGMSTEYGTGMLCIGCLEGRLGRNLNPRDFTSYPINKVPGSDRLMQRRGD